MKIIRHLKETKTLGEKFLSPEMKHRIHHSHKFLVHIDTSEDDCKHTEVDSDHDGYIGDKCHKIDIHLDS